MRNLIAYLIFMFLCYTFAGLAALVVLAVSTVLLSELIGKLGVLLLIGTIAALHLYWKHIHN